MVENLRTALEAWTWSFFIEMVFHLKLKLLSFKKRPGIEFFIMAREISKSDVYLFFANGSGKLLYETVTGVTE